MDLSVHIQLGHAPAGRVVGKTDGDGLGTVGQRHRDLKQLQKAKQSKKTSDIDASKTNVRTYEKPITNLSSDFFVVVLQHSIILLNNYYVQNKYNSYGLTINIFSVKPCHMSVCLLQHLTC